MTNKGAPDILTLKTWLWEAACIRRGPLDAPKFKHYILPRIFLKWLSVVFEDEVEHLSGEFHAPRRGSTLLLACWAPSQARRSVARVVRPAGSS